MKLYELAKNYQDVLAMMEDESDAMSLQDTLESIQDAIEVKAENIAKMIRALEAETDAIKTEEQRLAQRRKSIENRREGLKHYLESVFASIGIDKVKTAVFTISLQNNPPSVHVIRDEDIPKHYKVHVPESWNVDKKAILAAVKSGEEVPGIEITQGRSLRIR